MSKAPQPESLPSCWTTTTKARSGLLSYTVRVRYILAVPDKPVTTYVVSVFEKPHWRTALTAKDKDKALAMAKETADKARIEEITPKGADRDKITRANDMKREDPQCVIGNYA